MLLHEGHGVFAAFGHPKGVDAYYAEVAAENERREAAARAEREAILDGNDPVAWRKLIEEELNMSALHDNFQADLDAMTRRLEESAGVFYPEFVPPSQDVSEHTRAMVGPDVLGSEYSRTQGIVSHYIGPVAMSFSGGGVISERIAA
jgi:hypothetical protein